MGASDLAARRGAKANRRKAIVAQKRKIEAATGSPAGQVAISARLPIRACLLSEELFNTGMGTLVLARGATVGPIFFEAYLLDTFCRGVKDVMFRIMEQDQLDLTIDRMEAAAPMTAVHPSYARKLVRDLVRWSSSIGFPPPREFAALERLFGDVDPDACTTAFTFGNEGKPPYISGPNESPQVGKSAVRQLTERIGAEMFNYVMQIPAP